MTKVTKKIIKNSKIFDEIQIYFFTFVFVWRKYDCNICGESVDGEYYYWFRYDKEILYLIRVDWSNSDGSDCDVYVAKTLAAAIDKMKKLIEDERENTWAGEVFDEKGNVLEGYELVTNIDNPGMDRQVYWILSDEIETLIYTHITIEPMEAR